MGQRARAFLTAAYRAGIRRANKRVKEFDVALHMVFVFFYYSTVDGEIGALYFYRDKFKILMMRHKTRRQGFPLYLDVTLTIPRFILRV